MVSKNNQHDFSTPQNHNSKIHKASYTLPQINTAHEQKMKRFLQKTNELTFIPVAVKVKHMNSYHGV